MRTRLFVIIGILIFVSAATIGPVAAAETGGAAVTGNPKLSLSIALNLSAIYLPLDPETSPVSNASLKITVSSNTASFAVRVNDTSNRVEADRGFMGNYTVSAYDPINTKLTNYLNITGTSNTSVGNTVANTITTRLSSWTDLYTGSAKVNNQELRPNTFTQYVLYTDERLPDPSYYRIDLTFVIYAP